MINNNLLEGEELFKAIYETLMNNQDFIQCIPACGDRNIYTIK